MVRYVRGVSEIGGVSEVSEVKEVRVMSEEGEVIEVRRFESFLASFIGFDRGRPFGSEPRGNFLRRLTLLRIKVTTCLTKPLITHLRSEIFFIFLFMFNKTSKHPITR